MQLSIHERLELKLIPEPNTGCILWIGSSDKDGYGKIYWEKRQRRTHCVVYEIKNGPIPKGYLIQHKCDTPSCCNVDHLCLGTPKTNMEDKVRKGRLRNQWSNKNHCKYGHLFTKENTLFFNGNRRCKICYDKYLKNR